jgi:hypothetical protein
MTERKRQGLSRSQAAAVCNVSPSFIRDAESTPERCTLGKLLLLVQGLGLALEVNGWPDETPNAHFGTPTRALSPPSEDSAS